MAKPTISLMGATYSDVSGVELPVSGGGTASFPFVEGSDTVTQNGTYDVTALASLTVNVAGGGGSAEIETGEFKPTTDTGTPTIYFTNTHTTLPIFVMLCDSDGYVEPSNKNVLWTYMNWERLSGGAYWSSTSIRYGRVDFAYRASSASTLSVSNVYLTGLESAPASSSTSNPRYFVTETSFYPYMNNQSRIYSAGRTYKWIAVWK